MTMNVPDRKRERGFAIRTGLPWLVLFLGATVVLLIAGYTYYTHEVERIRNKNYEDLASVVNLKIDATVMWRKQRLDDVWILANGPFEREALSEWLRDQSNSILQKALQDRFVLEQQTRGYADILLFDLNGNMLLSAKPNPEPLSPAEREAVQETLTQGSPRLSNLYGSSSDGIIQLAAVAPVLSQGGKALAVAVMRSNAESLLYPLIRSWPTLSRTFRDASGLQRRRRGSLPESSPSPAQQPAQLQACPRQITSGHSGDIRKGRAIRGERLPRRRGACPSGAYPRFSLVYGGPGG